MINSDIADIISSSEKILAKRIKRDAEKAARKFCRERTRRSLSFDSYAGQNNYVNIIYMLYKIALNFDL